MSLIRDMDIIIDRLLYLDELCHSKGIIGEIVLLGGSGILVYMEMQGKGKFRPTMDIDVDIIKTNREQQEFREVISQANIDVVGGVMEVPPPEDFECKENHYKLNLDFKSIIVYVPNIELLACTKIFTKRQKDLDDLENTSLLDECDMTILNEMIQEYFENLMNPDDPDLNYYHLDRLFIKKGLK